MADDSEPNGGEVSDGMSENEHEYDDELDDSHIKDDDDKMANQRLSPEATSDGATESTKKKYDPKDPLRPRRRKARRACYACQRAHLTCGDERPCQRCIKRGLAEACQDGVRKKAKYLHDAPPEALGSVLGPNFNTHSSHTARPAAHRQPSSTTSEASSSVTAFYTQPSAPPPFTIFPPQSQVNPLPESLPFAASQQSPVSPGFQGPGLGHGQPRQVGGLTVPQSSGGDIPNLSAAFFDPSNPAFFNFNLEGLGFGSQYGAMEVSILGHMSSGAGETPDGDASISQPGAGDITFGSDLFGGSASGRGNYDKLYNGVGGLGDFLMDQPGGGLYPQDSLQHGLPLAYAIAAGPSSLQSPSTGNNSPQPTGFDGTPSAAPGGGGYGSGGGGGNNAASTVGGATATTTAQGAGAAMDPVARSKAKASTGAKLGAQSLLGRRQHRDASHIYDTVKDPYMYVSGFHRLIALLQRRLSASNVVKVAKSLASIRPSFIACTRTLSRADLVFMEKSFQRTLFEYEDFIHQTSSPTVLCRRTGEVVAVNKEFTALTGWRRGVMLGKEPNLNVNTGSATGSSNLSSTTTSSINNISSFNNSSTSHPSNPKTSSTNITGTTSNSSSSGPSAAAAYISTSNNTSSTNNSGRAGLLTPRLRSLNPDFSATVAASQQSGPQPLFIAELMDDDSVVEFYEDFSLLAFEDSRGHVNRKARLIKYRTAAEQQQIQQQQPASGSTAEGGSTTGVDAVVVKGEGGQPTAHTQQQQQQQQQQQRARVGGPASRSSILGKRVARIDGEHGISKIERDGKLECSYCWHIRRDTFDIPMMIVMNFLPCYDANQEPHQLAV